MQIDVTDMPELRVGAVRSDMAHIEEAQGELWSTLGETELLGRPGVVAAAVLPVEVITQGPGQDTPYHAAVIVPEEAVLPSNLTEERVPGGRYARAIHLGSYEGLADAWGEFAGQWLPSSGHDVREGFCYEIYRNNPDQAPEAELRTELYIPIQ